ncbi:MAG: glycosyltransferase [Verrucomicrobiota bacterium JB023]|nr:glycosyltransferase [Verrucomicrobiota bacterium JB023]
MIWLFPILALLGWFAFFLIFGRPRYLTKQAEGEQAPLSVIIPARDEEENLVGLLASLREQTLRPLEVIVVDDQSEDDTARVARQGGAEVLPAVDLPPGWKGKPWACQQGANLARGEAFLFLDADTRLEREGLAKLWAQYEERTALSILPYHRLGSLVEELSAFFNLLMAMGSNAFAPRWEREIGLFGQSLLIGRTVYQEIDGHERVKDKVLENLYLSQELRRAGVSCQAFLGRGTIVMRMFPEGFGQLWASWQKGAVAGAGAAPGRALLWSSLWISGAMFALVAILLTGLGGSFYAYLALAVYGLYVLQGGWALRRIGSYSWATALFFPIPLLFYQFLFLSTLAREKLGWRSTVKWKGRDVA